MKDYRKYVYWLAPEEFPRLEERLRAQGTPPRRADKAVCVPLAPNLEVGYVPAGSWSRYGLCRRQLSWQAVSPYAGQVLVVSRRPIVGLSPTTIVGPPRKLKPPRRPDRAAMLELIARPSYQAARPQQWEDIAAEDPAQQERWLRVMGIRGVSFAELFIGHRATHANFIEPAYYIEEDGLKVPYSLGRTVEVCSACLEFYGIIGGHLPRKLVVPCPGAVLFAGLAVNRYYEVTSPGADAGGPTPTPVQEDRTP